VWEPDLNVTPRTDDFACGTLIAEVLAPEPIGTLLFVNHLPNWQLTFEHERELQTVIAARTIEEIAEGRGFRHVVLSGDLDATPDAASVRFLRGRQSLGGMSVCYRDAWGSTHPGEPGHTFTAENPLVTAENWDWELELGRRIDHILVCCSDHGPTLDIRVCERIFDEPVDGVWGSDHFGVVADLSAQTSSGRPVR
jgi:endonuclease/exonuclease/phosphatase family metal-dependent hydrolase